MLRRDWSEAIAKRDAEGYCRVCNDYPVEAAHVIGRNRDHVVGGVAIVDPDSIVPLCRGCHGLFDTHQLDLLPHLTVREQQAAVRDAGGIMAALRRISGRDAA